MGYFGKESGENIFATGVFNFSTKKAAYVQRVEDINANTANWAKYEDDNSVFYFAHVGGSYASGHWYLTPDSSHNIMLRAYYYKSDGSSFGNFAPVVRRRKYDYISESGKVGNVTSSKENAYISSDFGIGNVATVIDGYGYHYLGSDTIDPTAISYPTTQLRPGDSLTVAVSPRTPTYGGTISYLYQYRVNGGAWTDIQTTTAASISFTVPASAKSIQFRARAQDNMGFTSATYVTGAAVTLERLNLWVGVNGKARKGMELYVGVNGKARKVTAAYIGVNGKARRFL